MTNGGECLERWMERVTSRRNRLCFMAEMLRQILPGLARLHDQGYSHGDLKLENICARTCENGSLKFTLIDFGMSQKIHSIRSTKDVPAKIFRGNLMFASDR